ncbi:MAG TPA: hypothetical protein VGW11_00895 [Solirubrobacteraceae bacterium]|nr:hypothetical protein [Solirubrobacteraceae bacterium]
MPRLVHLIADYGAGDLAFAEVVQRLGPAVPDAVVHPTPVGAFDTLSAGFVIAQLALTDGSPDRIVVHNVAPRQDQRGPRPANEGERFCAGRTRDGVLVIGPNAGWSWSFCASQLQSLHYLDMPSSGSQFRSRDFLPAAVGDLAAGQRHALRDPVPPGHIAPLPENAVAYVDGYGNVKTTIDTSPADSGARVLVRVGEVSATAIVTDGTFAVAEGELALAAGSSGWTAHEGTRRRFFELFLRGGSAAQRFAHPASGTPIHLEPAEPGSR